MKIGTKVEYRQHGKLIGVGKIVGVGTKNGMKVYDVTMSDGKCFWGYTDQFTPLKKKAVSK
jgi:predicted transcriptional regulator with HTH domain